MAVTSELVDHLFRHEAGKITSSLVGLLGLHNVDLAEDIVQETLCVALERWKFGRVPDRPAAWLMQVAKNRAIDHIRRERNLRKFVPALTQQLESEWSVAYTVENYLSGELQDNLLRMIFACCDPQISQRTQIVLVLKLLGGFSTTEIAHALLSSVAAVEKQISRGKRALRSGRLVDVAGAEALQARLNAAHAALYLLFSEGYHSAHPEHAVREELCFEAMRLTKLLAEHPRLPSPTTNALFALMCFNAARLPGRRDDAGELVLLADQDRGEWDQVLTEQGVTWLSRATVGDALSRYHLEAAISAAHCLAPSFEATDWRRICGLYDALVTFFPSPVVRLNRAIALAQLEGPEAGLEAIAAIESVKTMANYPFYHAAQAELLRRAGRLDESRIALKRALDAARTEAEARQLGRKLTDMSDLPGA